MSPCHQPIVCAGDVRALRPHLVVLLLQQQGWDDMPGLRQQAANTLQTLEQPAGMQSALDLADSSAHELLAEHRQASLSDTAYHCDAGQACTLCFNVTSNSCKDCRSTSIDFVSRFC